jgi:hypothetical protein
MPLNRRMSFLVPHWHTATRLVCVVVSAYSTRCLRRMLESRLRLHHHFALSPSLPASPALLSLSLSLSHSTHTHACKHARQSTRATSTTYKRRILWRFLLATGLCNRVSHVSPVELSGRTTCWNCRLGSDVEGETAACSTDGREQATNVDGTPKLVLQYWRCLSA